jgi:DNA polymerase III delta subunit
MPGGSKQACIKGHGRPPARLCEINHAKNAKTIARALVKEFKRLDRAGELMRDGEKIAKAINKLRAERKLTWEQRHTPVTI